MKKRMKDFNIFVEDFSRNIIPIYQNHEDTFDYFGIHGKLHISRSIIFAEFMARFYYKELNKDINFDAIRYAVAFHDSGRQGNGIDIWENDSSKKCFWYLMKKRSEYAKYSASLISKKKNDDINNDIVYDADVLEIMRPCCGHGERDGFNSNFLRFLKENNDYQEVRNNLIEESWKLIEYTEDNKEMFNDDTLYKLLNLLKNDNYSLLNSLF